MRPEEHSCVARSLLEIDDVSEAAIEQSVSIVAVQHHDEEQAQ